MAIKQINIKLRTETIEELKLIAEQLSAMSGDKIDTSKLIRYFMHKGIENKRDIIFNYGLARNFSQIVKLFDAAASLKAYDYSLPGAKDQMIKDHEVMNKEAEELNLSIAE